MTEEGKNAQSDMPRQRTKSYDKLRPSFYAEDSLLKELDEQVRADRDNKSAWLEKLVSLLLESSNGKRLRQAAARNERTLLEELKMLLSATYESLPNERIEKAAKQTQRDPYQMVAFLALLGLKQYEENQKQDSSSAE
jgi:hypothetical protein